MKIHKKPIVIVVLVVAILIMLHFAVTLVIGTAIQDTYSTVIVPNYRYVSYDELKTCPPDISMGNYNWFDDYLVDEYLNELEQYMRDRDLYISPGEYRLSRIKNFEDLKSRLQFTSGDRIPENAHEQYLAWRSAYD